jgi:asparagine synthase (glutamine-hydrolysing)
LTGEGSDEIFAGYAHFRQDAIDFENAADRETKLKHLAATNKASSGLLVATTKKDLVPSLSKVLGTAPNFLQAHAQLGKITIPLLTDSFLENYNTLDVFHANFMRLDLARQAVGRHPVHRALYLWAKAPLPNYILSVLGDRMEMAHSVEGRLTFLDHRVVEAVVRLPFNYKINGAKEKWILREACRDVLTKAVYERQKHPFLAPPAAASENQRFKTFISDFLLSSDLPAFYDRLKMRKFVDSLQDMSVETRTAIDSAVMILASMTALQRAFRLS